MDDHVVDFLARSIMSLLGSAIGLGGALLLGESFTPRLVTPYLAIAALVVVGSYIVGAPSFDLSDGRGDT